MSDLSAKTEPSTPFKRKQAREKGQVARSHDLVSFILLLVFVLTFSALAYPLATTLHAQMFAWLSHAGELAVSPDALTVATERSLRAILYTLLPLLLALIISIILTHWLFSGLVFSVHPLIPDMQRLSPMAGIKRTFSRRLIVDLMKTLVKGGLFALVLYCLLIRLVPAFLATATLMPMALAPALLQVFLQVSFGLLLVLAVAALFDAWYAHREFARQLRMSQHEVRQEYREHEGSPELRATRQHTQQLLFEKIQALACVKQADVIITDADVNSTEQGHKSRPTTQFAIALTYRPEQGMSAPRVLALGRGVMAQRIRQMALHHGLPVRSQPLLAAQLLAQARLNESLPESCFMAVAGIYRELNSAMRNRGQKP